MKTFKGLAVCKGIAIGPVHQYRHQRVKITQAQAQSAAQEWARVVVAQQQAAARLQSLAEKTRNTLQAEQAEIFEVHGMMLEDPDFCARLQSKIEQEGCSAEQAVQQVCQEFLSMFEQLDDPYMRERATDVRDVEGLLLDGLLGERQTAGPRVPSVVVADDLTPSDTLQMDKQMVLAFVTRKGSENSHAAILARTMGIPSVVQVPLGEMPLKGIMAVDGFTGECFWQPDEATVARLENKRKTAELRHAADEAVRGCPSVTKGGKEVHVCANVGGADDIALALDNDADGIGLFRSEFLYLERKEPATENMQFAAYKNAGQKMRGKRVIIRTADIGADKQAEYLNLSPEENPALGYRGVRLWLDRPDLHLPQLRAICRAAAYGTLSVMFPMVTSVQEIRACKQLLQHARSDVEREGEKTGPLEIGVMIETPAAVMLCEQMAQEVDFFSVGTNDLTQYTLAADRQNAQMRRFANPQHPAVLAMLRQVAHCAQTHGIWAGICGALAEDTGMTQTLVEMGYTELSVPPPQVLGVRKAVRACP